MVFTTVYHVCGGLIVVLDGNRNRDYHKLRNFSANLEKSKNHFIPPSLQLLAAFA